MGSWILSSRCMSGQVGLPSPNKRHIFWGDAISFTNKRDMFQCISDLISKNYEKLFDDFFWCFHCRSHSSVCINWWEKFVANFHPNVIFMDKMSVDFKSTNSAYWWSKWLYLINMALRTTFTGQWTWQHTNVMKFFQPESIEEEK